MSSIDTNRLRERLGDGTGIGVRSSPKYLDRRGVEVVPAGDLVSPAAFRIYYRGTMVERLTANGVSPTGLVARIYEAVADHLNEADEL